MNKRWIVKEPGNETEVQALSASLQTPGPIANLLVQRGIGTKEKVSKFFHPDLKDLHDPFLMKDMHPAVDRIMSAMDRHERILIYGDYDVDGITSVALVYSFFRNFYDNLGYYIPDRNTEGYGVSIKGIDYASENNYALIIALDCGIKAVDKVKYAKGKNIDFIICDHHMPGQELPDAEAVLDPKRKDDPSPFKDLSGCGVGYKLLQAYASINSIPHENLTPYLELVAVSIASDIVPVIGENRILAAAGLRQLNSDPGVGMRTICKIAGVADKELSITDVVFKIGPRINAAGRMKAGSKAVDLLVSQNEKEAMSIGHQINTFNHDRRKKDQEITREALLIISSDHRIRNSKATVLYNPKWHKGVIGIVASRLIETHFRPTVVLTESHNGLVTGSARSVPGFDLYQAMESCSHLLENFGGHMYAAGLTLKKERVSEFTDCFEKAVNDTITDEQLIPVVDIDMELKLSEINKEFLRTLKQFQPFGPENMAPVFVSRMVSNGSASRLVGANGEHLKLELLQENSSIFSAIAFNQSHNFDIIQSGKPFQVCYCIEENEFRGKTTIQLNIRDIKPEE